MEYKDYYKIMGVDRNATQDEVRRAYRKLARKYHPDVSKEAGAEERFKELGEAYEVLRDPEKRAAYDQLGSGWKSGQEFHPPPGWDQGFEFHTGDFAGTGAEEFSDFFESLFGRGFARGGSRHHRDFHAHGQDTHAKVVIDLDDAYKGATRTITLQHPELSSGGRPEIKKRTLNVRIPKGVRQGQHIRLAGQGGAGVGKGKAGDLYLEIEFRPHPFYRVEDKDIYLDLPITPWEAALGATIKVPTPGGTVDLKIPAGSTSGSKLRLKGRGIPSAPPGDLYAVMKIVIPPADDEESKSIYRDMAEKLAFNPRSRLGV